MKKNILFMLICGWTLATTLASCGYDEYADADYPETTIYQPMALESIWNIDTPNPDGSEYVTPGGSKRYEIDKANNKFIVLLGVVQSGIEFKSSTVDISIDHSIVNTMIMDGRLPVGTLPLPASAYSLPSSVELASDAAFSPFRMEIDLNTLLDGDNIGKKFAIAVKISSMSVAVNDDLDTAVICIDTNLIQDLI